MRTAGILAVSLLLLCASAYAQDKQVDKRAERCDNAMAAHRFAVQLLKLDPNAGSPKNISNELQTFSKAATNQNNYRTQQVNMMPIFDGTPYAAWANEIFQWVLANNLQMPSSQSGEMIYLANGFLDDIALLTTNGSDLGEAAYKLWAKRWYDYADNILAQAKNQSDTINRRNMLTRALNYYFAAFYPYPTNKDSNKRLATAQGIFKDMIGMFNAYDPIFFNVTYKNNSATTTLQAVFVTPARGFKVPVIVHTSSVHNWKEMLFIRYGPGALRRNYAVLFVDGPGMGSTVRQSPYMPVQSDYDQVVSAILDAMQRHPGVSPNYDAKQVILMGASIGGYLTGQACSKLAQEKRISACILNPGFINLADAYNKILSANVYNPMTTLAVTNPKAFPNQTLVTAFLNPIDNIVRPLLMDCEPDSGVQMVFGSAFRNRVLLPSFVHMAAGFLGLNYDGLDLNEIPNYMWDAYRTVNYNFDGYNPENQTVPTAILVGQLDGLASDQVKSLRNQLPEDFKSRNILRTFDVASGGALPSQLGAFALYEQEVYPWLKQVLPNAPQK